MIFMDDLIKATLQLIEAPAITLSRRVYNLAAFSFTPAELTSHIKKHLPDAEVTYRPDHRQLIAESWPKVLDDSNARRDWGWKNDYNIEMMTEEMLKRVRRQLSL